MLYRMQRRQVQEGFTLIELAVAVLILGILMSVTVIGFKKVIYKARVSKTHSNLITLKNAIDLFHGEYVKFPATLQDLVERPKGEGFATWKADFDGGPVPKDGWGNEFYYKLTPGKKHSYELYSYGSEGPEGPIEDQISVWDLNK